jgi:hypothetical protein
MRLQLARAVVLMVVVCGVSSVASGQETNESVSTSRVVALKNLWDRASEQKDRKVLDQILDDAFVSVGDDGKLMNKAEILKDLSESKVQQVITESIVVHVHGETAIATGLQRVKVVVRGQPVTRRSRFVDTWLFKDGRWVGAASVSTPME